MSKEAIITIVLGRRGSGKSVKVRNLTKDCSRVLFYDTLNKDYTDGIVIDNLQELKGFWSRHYRGDFRIVYRPEEPAEEFAEVCALVYACGFMHFVVEELDSYFSAGRSCREFNNIVFRGRHKSINLIGVSQRPFGFGRGLTSQAKEWFVFSTREPNDVSWLEKYFGQEFIEQLKSLNPAQYQYIHWFDTGDINVGSDSL